VPYIPWTHYVSNIGYSISTIVAAEEIQSWPNCSNTKKLRLPYMHKSRKKYKESKRATMGSMRKGTNQA
jgi:hypothetical protein